MGEYHNKLDSKGRVAIPAKFRNELGSTIVINRYYTDGCLAIYTEKAWNDKYQELVSQPDNHKDVRNLIRIITSTADQVQFDSQGRVLVPSNLVKLVGLEKDCVFIGAGDHIELWPEDKWNAFNEALTDEEIDRISENL